MHFVHFVWFVVPAQCTLTLSHYKTIVYIQRYPTFHIVNGIKFEINLTRTQKQKKQQRTNEPNKLDFEDFVFRAMQRLAQQPVNAGTGIVKNAVVLKNV